VVRVSPHAKVKTFLSGDLDEVYEALFQQRRLIPGTVQNLHLLAQIRLWRVSRLPQERATGNLRSFESLRAQLFVLVGDHWHLLAGYSTYELLLYLTVNAERDCRNLLLDYFILNHLQETYIRRLQHVMLASSYTDWEYKLFTIGALPAEIEDTNFLFFLLTKLLRFVRSRFPPTGSGTPLKSSQYQRGFATAAIFDVPVEP
jgi:hypothetical protein